MANADKRRQKKLAKHKAKRTEKRKKITRSANMGIGQRLQSLSTAPILECRIGDTSVDQGMLTLRIARERDGKVGFAVFLIDTYCLGIKDAFGDIRSEAEYRAFRAEHAERQPMRDIDPPSARKLIEDAVAFAGSLGFSPHGDFLRVRSILGDIDPEQAQETFEMGRDGKPMFIQGPHDSEAFCMRVMNTLNATSRQRLGGVDTPHGLAGNLGVDDVDDDDDGWENG